MRKRRLLTILGDQLLPISNGYNLRAYNIISNLLDDWSVDVICFATNDADQDQNARGLFNRILYYSSGHPKPAARKKSQYIRMLLSPPQMTCPGGEHHFSSGFSMLVEGEFKRGNYDNVLCFGSGVYVLYAHRLKGSDVTCDVIDSSTLFLKSVLGNTPVGCRRWLSNLYELIYSLLWEKRYLGALRKVVVISEYDKLYQKLSVPKRNIYVVGNGVDYSYFNPAAALPGSVPGLVVFTGVMNYGPNHDAMMYCLSSIWPLIKAASPFARLKIVGRSPRPELIRLAEVSAGVEVTGEVKDIREAVRGANIFLCPMRFGAGIKNKLLESLAMGIPVVATEKAVKGISFAAGRIGYVANEPSGLVKATVKLLSSVEVRSKMSTEAREFAVYNFDWRRKAGDLSRVLLA